MAVPAVTNIYPAVAHTGGEAIVQFLGSGFNVPPDPLTLRHEDPAPGPTVLVTFGGAAAQYVGVVNGALMYVKAPASPLVNNSDGDAEGPVDVVVTNLDTLGEPIPGESVTLPGVFFYKYTKLSTTTGTLQRVVRAVLRAMRQQIYPNVVYMGHTDYDENTSDGMNLVEIATVPSLAVMGPRITKNALRTSNERQYVDVLDHVMLQREPAYSDLGFTVIGTTDNTTHALNLQAEVIEFFSRFVRIGVLNDATDPALGYSFYDVVIPNDGMASIDAGSDDSNLRTFSHRFTIQAYPIRGLEGFPESAIGGGDMTDAVGGEVDDIILTIVGI